jgi:dGTPase
VLEGISKHQRDQENPISGRAGFRYPSLEAQVADFADGIAYNAHDLDDGITSSLLDIGNLREVALWRENEKLLDNMYTNLDFKLKKYQIVRRIINDLITDFREHTLKNLKKLNIKSPDDIRSAPQRVAGFAPEMEAKNKELKQFLFAKMYTHRRVMRMEFKAELYLTEIFKAYKKLPVLLPESSGAPDSGDSLERKICDYVSGMTDRYAISEYKKFFIPDERD